MTEVSRAEYRAYYLSVAAHAHLVRENQPDVTPDFMIHSQSLFGIAKCWEDHCIHYNLWQEDIRRRHFVHLIPALFNGLAHTSLGPLYSWMK